MTQPQRPIDRDPAFLRGLTGRRITRRDALRYAGMGVGGFAVAQFLAACGVGGTRDDPSPGASPTQTFDWASQERNGIVNFANWPAYIDTKKGSRPSLDMFTEETGIEVNYKTPINENESFLATIEPQLQAERYVGYDIIVITNSFVLDRIIQNGWATPLDHSRLENFAKYSSDSVKNPTYDPDNQYTIAWQSGMTGIAYNPKLTKREITSFEDLFDPAFAGHVGMFGDNLDLPNMTLLGMGITPEDSTEEDWQKAQEKLVKQREDGIVRKYYDQAYKEALEQGDVWLSMAWSGDIFQSNLEGFEDLQFVIPDEGGLIWTDNMLIPANPENPVDAITLMDYVYRPEVAALIADWVNYITPVPAAQPIIRNELDDPPVADSPFVFPDEETLSRVKRYATLTPEEQDVWNDLFEQVYQA